MCLLSMTEAPIELLALDMEMSGNQVRELVQVLRSRGFKVKVSADNTVYIRRDEKDWRHVLGFALDYWYRMYESPPPAYAGVN